MSKHRPSTPHLGDPSISVGGYAPSPARPAQVASPGRWPGDAVGGQAAVALELPGGGLGRQAEDAIDLDVGQGPASLQAQGWANRRHITTERPARYQIQPRTSVA